MADAIDQHVGGRLSARRHSLGLTLQEVARAAGTTLQQVHKYETGSSRMTPARLWSLAKALGVDVNYFFEGFGKTGSDVAGDDGRGRLKTG
ncbi:MAG TPA: helix-turn-helix transcriptional regulator [Caulobacteraceae bacterium]|nr:helix-turn-helix transcriptional regulator [Caulobacteraceae bacterium]